MNYLILEISAKSSECQLLENIYIIGLYPNTEEVRAIWNPVEAPLLT